MVVPTRYKQMKPILLTLAVLITTSVAAGQMVSGAADIITVYSQNDRFYLKSIPYDDESPSLKGETSVYEKGKATPLYTLNRGFDVDDNIASLFLSNDGETIFYVVQWGGNENTEGLKSVNVYKTGKLIRSFTESEITGCDKKKERCNLVYSNLDKVVDLKKSQAYTKNYKRVFKDGVDEKEKFLSDFALFSFDDTVYLTDYQKRTHIFDLRDGRLVESDSFDNVFERIKGKGRFTKTEVASYKAPTFYDFPNLKDGRYVNLVLANQLGMTASNLDARYRYKLHSFKVTSTISQDGTVEIQAIEVDSGLPKDKILQFFSENRFDTRSIPKAFPKWDLGEQYFYFRNKNIRVARQERRLEQVQERKDLETRLTLEKIGGVYIPANLGECFVELDKKLSEVDKKEMQAKSKRDDMILYHLGLGTWMRNNWGLWGGSRLSKYFNDKGVTHPEGMSSIILYHYHDWLNDKKDTWKEWEKSNKQGHNKAQKAQ